MNKTYTLKPLTKDEQLRLMEMRLYHQVEHLFKVMGNRIKTYELIEIICDKIGVSINTTKTVINALTTTGTTLAPTKLELCVLLYRLDYPVAKICNIANITAMTVYNYLNKYQKHPEEFTPRLREDVILQIAKLYEFLKELYSYDGY